MKILAFTDFHGSLLALKRIEQKTKMQNPDLLVCSGDISVFEHGIGSIFRRLNKLNKKIIIVHGNHEDSSTYSRYSKIFKNIIFIHEKYFISGNLLFLGYGGGGFALVDKKFDKVSVTMFKKIIKQNKYKKKVLVVHGPPYGTRLDKLGRNHAGNKSIRYFIERNNINYVICGHLHENFGKEDRIKKTNVINPGPFGKIIDL